MTEPTAASPPYESAAEMRHANTQLLQALDERLGTDSRPESEAAALAAMRPDIESFLQRGAATGCYVDDTQERTACQVLLDYWSSSLAHARMDVGRPRLVPFNAQALPDLKDKPCPFVGLEAFSDDTHRYFFGREKAAADLLARLGTTPLVVVQGGSGSGKSSLVMAGVLPVLGAPDRDPRWRIVGPFTPGNAVLERLARVVLGANADTAAAVDAMRRDPMHLVAMVGGAQAPALVLVVDQFEEVFTLSDETERQVLAAAFAGLLQARPGDRVILTMREEFSSQLDELVPLRPLLSGPARFSMGDWPMGYEQLKAAVEGPAALVNLQFQPGIVDDMVQSVSRSGTTALPLLQFALRRLWDRRQRNRITWDVYKQIGASPLKALELFADDVYDGVQHFEEKRVEFERVLTELVRVNRLLEPYRQQVLRSQLLAAGSAQTPEVLDLLERHEFIRVTPTESGGDAVVEVKHEALLRNWPRYKEWIDAKRERVRQRIALNEAAQRWDAGGRSASEGLLGGWQLQEVQQLRDLSALEEAYVQSSADAADRDRIARELALRRQEWRKSLVGAAAVVALATVVTFGWLAWDARQDRKREAGLRQQTHVQMQISQAKEQIARAKETSYRQQIDHALTGALRAVNDARSIEDRAASIAMQAQLREMLLSNLRNAAGLRRLFVGDAGAVFHAATFHPTRPEALLAFGGSGGTTYVAGLVEPFAKSLDSCGTSIVTALAFDAAGHRLAAGCGDGTLSVWSTDDWSRLGRTNMRVFERSLWTLAFSPDGRTIAAGGYDRHIALVGLTEDGAPLNAPLATAGGTLPIGYVWSMVFSPAGDTLLAGDGVGTVLVCRPAAHSTWSCTRSRAYPGEPDKPPAETDAIRALAYTPDGQQIAVGRWNGGVELWDADFSAKSRVPIDVGEWPGPVHGLSFFEACGRRQLAIGKGTGLQYRSADPSLQGAAPAAGCAMPRSAPVGDETYGVAFHAPTGLLAAATRGSYVAVLEPAAKQDPLRTVLPPMATKKGLPVRGTIVAEEGSQAWLAVPIVPAGPGLPNLALRALREGRIDGAGGVAALSAGDAEILRVSASTHSRRLATLGCRPASAERRCAPKDPHEVAVWRFAARLEAVAPIVSVTAAEFGALLPRRIALSPDGQRLVIAFEPPALRSGAGDAEAQAWRELDVQARRILVVPIDGRGSRTWVESGLQSLRELAFSPDGRLFAAGGTAPQPQPGAGVDQVRLWNVSDSGLQPSAQPPLALSPLANKVSDIAFAADARGHSLLLAGGDSGAIDRWDVASGRELGTLRADSRPVQQIAFSAAASAVAAADSQNVVRLWDTDSWSAIQLTPPTDRVDVPGYIAFGGDGGWLVSGASTLQLWDVDIQSLRRKVCALMREPGQHGADSPTPLWRRDGLCEPP